MKNKKNIILSFCIPNFDNGKELDQNLSSIYIFSKQHLEIIEVCVSDNNSKDNTKLIITKWEKKFPNFIKKLNETNIGFQKNLIQSLSISSGQFKWILGADDEINASNNIKYLFELFKIKSELYILNRNLCDKDLMIQKKDRYLNTEDDFITHDWSNPVSFMHYIEKSENLNSLGCFISSLILPKSTSDSFVRIASNDDFYLDNIFPHVYLFLKIKNQQEFNVTYISIPFVNWRSDNSSFSESAYARYLDVLDLVNITHSQKNMRLKHRINIFVYEHYKKIFKKKSIVYNLIKGNLFNESFIFTLKYDFNSNLKYRFFKTLNYKQNKQ